MVKVAWAVSDSASATREAKLGFVGLSWVLSVTANTFGAFGVIDEVSSSRIFLQVSGKRKSGNSGLSS